MVFLPPGGQCWEKCLPRTLRSSVLISAGTTWVCVPDSCPEYIRIGYVNTRMYTVHHTSLCFVQVHTFTPFQSLVLTCTSTLHLSLSLSCLHTLSLSLPHTHAHLVSLSYTHPVALSHTHMHTLSHSVTQTLSHTSFLSYSHAISLTHTPGASGGKALLEGLQRNGNMIELMLAGNKVTDETLKSIEHCMHKVSGVGKAVRKSNLGAAAVEGPTLPRANPTGSDFFQIGLISP